MSKIDFIGIGAQKAGSSWLYQRLRELDEFDLPPIKELHYFDNFKGYRINATRSEPKLLKRMKSTEWLRSASIGCAYALRHGGLSNLTWHFNYYFSNYNDDWYASLFAGYGGIKGEITPSYAALNEQDIERIYSLFPDVKIIYMIRNPVERAWSAYRFSTHKLRPDHSIIEYLDSPSQELNSNYIDNIDRFIKYFPKEQILIGFFDAISEQPDILLESIVEWLGGDKTKVLLKCKLDERNKVSKVVEMPNEVRNHLDRKYALMNRRLASMFGGYASNWAGQSVGSEDGVKLPPPVFTFL